MLDVFAAIRERLALTDVLSRYGINIERGNMVKCPFHDDKHPSAKIYPHNIHCFTCGQSWDAVGLVADLYQLRPIDAARKLSEDFNLDLFDDKSLSFDHKSLSDQERQRIKQQRIKERQQIKEQQELVKSFKKWWKEALESALWYREHLRAEIKRLKPKKRTDDYPDEFCKALRALDAAECLIWELQETEENREKVTVFIRKRKAVAGVEFIRRASKTTTGCKSGAFEAAARKQQ